MSVGEWSIVEDRQTSQTRTRLRLTEGATSGVVGSYEASLVESREFQHRIRWICAGCSGQGWGPWVSTDQSAPLPEACPRCGARADAPKGVY